ncbi:MAG: galactose ABC transporter substrate-binding protein [Firmicutes bacterium]|nr:galactose ABC transporter substrate-binding protein [Bacillota bacterium]
MKKLLSMVLALVLVLGLSSVSLAAGPTIGVCVYKFDDTFMTGVRNAISKAAEGIAEAQIVDSQNAQATQNDQVIMFVDQGFDGVAINPVDRTACAEISKKTEAAGIPVVYFNREPIAEEMTDFDNWYYVGAKAEESGTMSGQILVDYFTAHPEAIPEDGVIRYVMLQGEPGHQDAELRSIYSIKCLEDAGFTLEALAVDTAHWNRIEGMEKMTAWLAAFGDKIDCVLANNDDMALGAIEALKAEGYFTEGKFMPVVGVDATAPALEALKEGTLLGTVLNDAANQGAATLLLTVAAVNGDFTGFPYEIVDDHYVWVPYQMVTEENYTDFE